jgi:hypothetical protein
MAQAARDMNVNPVRSTEREVIAITSSVAIGAAGAVDSTIAGYRVAPGVTVANTGTGTFSLAYPVCPNATIKVFVEMSAAATVTEAILTAKSPTAGTATIRTSKAGTATNPASGDLIGVVILALSTGVT